MGRRRRGTGRRPGAPDGNANALKHGYHSQVARAEKLRAHSALRSARALDAAMKLKTQQTVEEKEAEEERLTDERDAAEFREVMAPFRHAPNLLGVLADIVRFHMAKWWMESFDETAPDYIYAWADAFPGLHVSPVLAEDEDPVTGEIAGAAGGGGGEEKNMKTTLPPIHPNSVWAGATQGIVLEDVENLEEAWVDLVEAQRWFPGRQHAAGFVNWKFRQLRAHGHPLPGVDAGDGDGSAA